MSAASTDFYTGTLTSFHFLPSPERIQYGNDQEGQNRGRHHAANHRGGGLFSSTVLTLLVLPVMYRWLEERAEHRSRETVMRDTEIGRMAGDMRNLKES